MKRNVSLFALVLAAGLAACSPAEDTPDPGALPIEPTVESEFTDVSEAGAATLPDAAVAGPLALTAFTPATNEIYCSFFNIGDDGLRGERVFITEIAGVPAPAHVGLEGQDVPLTQVTKAEDASPQEWVYANEDRGLKVDLRVTETAKGFESRDYEGTIQVTQPAEGPLVAISGTCGV